MTERQWRSDVSERRDRPTNAEGFEARARRRDEAAPEQAGAKLAPLLGKLEEALKELDPAKLKARAKREVMADLRETLAKMEPRRPKQLRAAINRVPDEGLNRFFELAAEQNESRRHGR